MIDEKYGGDSNAWQRNLLNRSGFGYCFVSETKILMSDNTEKNIENVRIGDYVKTYNFENNEIQISRVNKIDSPIHDNLVKISFTNRFNINTTDHPYYVKEKGWASFDPILTRKNYNFEVEELEEGDVCYALEDSKIVEIKIEKIELFEEGNSQRTYNLSEVDKNHNFFANGILVHNKAIKNNDMNFIYILLLGKFHINKLLSNSKDHIIFSSKLILASELALNIITIISTILIWNYEKYEPHLNKQNILLVLIFSFTLPVISLFSLVKDYKVLSFIDKNKNSKKTMSIFIGVSYSAMTIIIFIYYASKLRTII